MRGEHCLCGCKYAQVMYIYVIIVSLRLCVLKTRRTARRSCVTATAALPMLSGAAYRAMQEDGTK